MVHRRSGSIALAIVLLLLGASPALGAGPAPGAGPIAEADPEIVIPERALTPEEELAAERKYAEALRYLAELDASGGLGANTVCPLSADGSSPQHNCPTPEGFLTVYARQQQNGIYCGPAVGQVITNYVWAMPSGSNKFSQNTIAGWMKTNQNGGTSAHDLAYGLNVGTNGSPRKPANWVWVVQYLDVNYVQHLHNIVRSNINGSHMPVALAVKPHEPGAFYRLASWPNPVKSPGHWIALYGWRHMYDGTDKSYFWYTDSSAGYGGATGKFADPARHIGILVRQHTNRVVW